MENKLFTQSKNISHEYCCTIVKIGQVKPIDGSDFLGTTLVNGLSIVVRKDHVHEGDYLFYAANETCLNMDFLSINNLFEFGARDFNANYKEVERLYRLSEQLKSEDKFEEASDIYNEAKSMVGFFNKTGRVKMIKLRGTYSMGFLFSLSELANWCPLAKDFDMASYEGYDFDTVNGELFVKAYVPPIKESQQPLYGVNKRNKKLNKFNRMIPGEFTFHYDTQQLNREITRISPEQSVTISVKLHGSSFIMGNIKVKYPRYGGLYSKLYNMLPKWLQFTKIQYDNVYSSRNVIQNSNINLGNKNSFYEVNIYSTYYDLLKGKIPEGYIIYGEIIGYQTKSNAMVQKGYDYQCRPGENKLMIYRISEKIDNTTKEWNVMDIYNWTINLVNQYPELKPYIHPIDILYHGTLKDLYPEISYEHHWHENILEAMKNDVKHFGMEKDEPLCRTKIPREGIVLRIDDDPINEAFKLKCMKFLQKESKTIDSGEVDIELAQGRY